MASTRRVAREASVEPSVAAGVERIDDIALVVDEYLVPAALAVMLAAHDGDVDAVRAYASELLMATGTVIAACPRPRDRPPG